MKKKIRNIVWIIVLFAASFPVGFAYQVVYSTGLVYSEVVLNFIVGGISLIIVFGGLSLLLYRFLKRKEIGTDPAKVALGMYTLGLVIMLLFVSPQFEEAVYKHRVSHLIENQL